MSDAINFHDFYLAGGRMTLAEWNQLSEEQRVAAAADGRAILIDGLTKLAEFIQSPTARMGARAVELAEREAFEGWLMEQQAAAWRASKAEAKGAGDGP